MYPPVMKYAAILLLLSSLSLFAQNPPNPAPPPQAQQAMRPPQPAQPVQPFRQPQPPQPMQSPRPDYRVLREYLDLSDSQIRRMEQAREKARRDADEKEKTLRPQIEEKRMAMEDLLDKPDADATAVGRAMIEIRGMERQIRQAREAARTAELNILTAEQKAKFKAIQDAANLPEAARQAQLIGLVPGPAQPAAGPRPPAPQPPVR